MNKKNKITNTEQEVIDDPMKMFASLLGGPGAIERSEAQGQEELVESEVLPTHYNGDKKKDFEKIGIVFGDVVEGDSMFQEVTLPAGWKKIRTDHSMWSKLIDEQGRERASIFYKAACYDRSAHMNLVRRFMVDTYKYDNKGVVLDGGSTELFEHEHNGEYDGREIARGHCEQWLKENYPEWEDKTAYWDN